LRNATRIVPPPSTLARGIGNNATVTPGLWRKLGDRASVWPGRNHPLGATWSPESTNFAVHAPSATAAWVCLFDDDGAETRHQLTEQSLGIWHGALPDVPPGARYGFRADGPWQPQLGLRFNADKLLLDPFARAVSGDVTYDPAIFGHDLAAPDERSTTDSAPYVPRSVVLGADDFDWQGDRPLRHRWRDTVIYEAHVKGMTALHDRVPEELRGSYAGMATPAVVDYLRDLGVTAVELLPIHQFASEPAVVERGLVNYWGYNSIGFFAPHNAYAASGDRGQQVTEFKQMVRSMHAAGIEVILDVVYNHTAEAAATGPTLSFRGLDDHVYYRVGNGEPGTPPDETYWDVTGCGNTVDAAYPFALRLILDSLRYWVTEMHVDGFRFDLLSALTRVDHEIDMGCHLLTAIGQDPVLRHVKLIAEPWDASMGGYRVGECPPPWVEWNDQYRDEIRDFWRESSSGIRTVATRLAGSSDLYADDGRSPYASINFVTAHDGFTVRDLVTYESKHNEANGENNSDGTDNNRSCNHGVAPDRRQPDGDAVPVQRGADDHRGRRAGPDPARQQQRLLPGQRALLDRLATRRRVARRLRGDQGRPRPAAGPPRPAAAALVRGPAGDAGRPEGPRLAAPRGPGDGRGRLARRRADDARDVRQRQAAARPRAPRRAAGRRVLRHVVRLRERPGHRAAPGERVGAQRRGRALHRPRPPHRHPGQDRRGAHPRRLDRRRAPRDLTRRRTTVAWGEAMVRRRRWVRALVSRTGYDVQRVRTAPGSCNVLAASAIH
jgi:glycogen operon protein